MQPVKKHILVIDDEEDLRDILSFQFKIRGYEVTTAKDGVDGLVKLHDLKPDLIVLDLNMPRMGGIEFYQKLCGFTGGHPAYPIMVLTARANTRQLFLDLEIDGFLTKPFEIDDVIKEAEYIIKNAARKRDIQENKPIENVFLIDPDPKALSTIGSLLLGADLKVSTSLTGTKAIEKMMNDVPDLVLVNLGLADLPGDVLVTRLMQIARTSKVRFVLYIDRNGSHDKEVLINMAKKTGVEHFIEYGDPKELVELIEKLKTG